MVGFAYTGPVCRVLDDYWVNQFTHPLTRTPLPGIVPLPHVEAHQKTQQQKKSQKHHAPAAKPVPILPEEFLAHIKIFEGTKKHMYLDTKDLVTVGIGFLIENPKTQKITPEGLAMPFIVDATKKVASRAEILAEFDNVLGGHDDKISLSLDDTYISKAFDQKVASFTAQLQSEIPHYDSLPIQIRYALLDMIFNLGVGKEWKEKGKTKRNGLHAYLGLKKALADKDWLLAAEHSLRHGPAPDRNNTIKSWFQYPATHPAPTPGPAPIPMGPRT